MKFGRQIFLIRRLYNSFGIPLGTSRDFPDSFYEIFFIVFRILVLIIFTIFRAKMLKWGRTIFFIRGLYNGLGTFAGLPGSSVTVSMKYYS